jgi:hypothetical protein
VERGEAVFVTETAAETAARLISQAKRIMVEDA